MDSSKTIWFFGSILPFPLFNIEYRTMILATMMFVNEYCNTNKNNTAVECIYEIMNVYRISIYFG